MEQIKKHFTLKNLIEFIKLQLAGNILFWGTMLGSFVLKEWAGWSDLAALVTASIASHVLFFIADKEWVFNTDSGREKTTGEVIRFAIFMGLNFFINLGIVLTVSDLLMDLQVPYSLYLAQFVSALFFTVWTYLGLKFWVFHETYHHSLFVKWRPYVKRFPHHPSK